MFHPKKGNGYISTTTLKELLREIAPDLSDKDLDAAVDEIDEDGSGKIEFEGASDWRVTIHTFVNCLEFWELMAGGEYDWCWWLLNDEWWDKCSDESNPERMSYCNQKLHCCFYKSAFWKPNE